MFILIGDQSLINACGDYGLASILRIIQKVMGMIQIVVPIIMIFSIIFVLIRMMTSPEDKKIPRALRNAIFAGVIIIFLPMIVNLVMNMLGDSFSVTACWNVAEQTEDMIEWKQEESQSKKKPTVKNSEKDYNFSSGE